MCGELAARGSKHSTGYRVKGWFLEAGERSLYSAHLSYVNFGSGVSTSGYKNSYLIRCRKDSIDIIIYKNLI